MGRRIKCSKYFLQIPSSLRPHNTSIDGLNGVIFSRAVVAKPDCREVRGNERVKMEDINYQLFFLIPGHDRKESDKAVGKVFSFNSGQTWACSETKGKKQSKGRN